MKINRMPVIAVSSALDNGNTFVHRDYTESVVLAGGIPLVIPSLVRPEWMDRVREVADGLLLTGGEDVDPNLYGEEPLPGLGTVSPERDIAEVLLARRFMAADKPIFAICRGLQLLNAVAGGTLFQDIERKFPDCLQHRQLAPRSHLSHQVVIADGSLLEKSAGAAQIRVNSFHHQAVKQPAPGFRVNAVASDGVVEGVESVSHRFVLGVQWHPENLARTDDAARKLFTAFVDACRGQ